MTSVNAVLSNPELQTLGVAERRVYQAGDSIITEGADDRCVYLLEDGLARVSERVEIEGAKHIQPGLCDLAGGDVFGELSLFEAAPRSASVVAVKRCEALVFDAEKLSVYFDANPDQGYVVLKALFNVLNQRLRQADKRLGLLFAWGLKAHGIDRHL